MPIVLPASSEPRNFDFSQRPAAIEAAAAGTRRRSARRSANVCSTAETTLAVGAFRTRTPRAVAAGTSTLSTPTPARATTCSRGAAARSFVSTAVALRTRRASASARAVRRSPRDAPERSWTSWPRSRRRARPDSASFSATTMRLIDRSPGGAILTRRPEAPVPLDPRRQLPQIFEQRFRGNRLELPPRPRTLRNENDRAARGAREFRIDLHVADRERGAGGGSRPPHRTFEHRRMGLGRRLRTRPLDRRKETGDAFRLENHPGEGGRFVRGERHREAASLDLFQDFGHAVHQLGLLDRDLGIALPEEADAFRRQTRADALLEEVFESVADHPANLRERAGRQAEATERMRQRVRDRGVPVDQGAVQIEDDELQRAGRSHPARRRTASAIISRSSKRYVGRSSGAAESETRASAPVTGTPGIELRATSIFGIGRFLYPSTRTRSQEENSRSSSLSISSSEPNRRAVVRPGVTKEATRAPASAWRRESLPSMSSSASREECLTVPTTTPRAARTGSRLTISEVFPELWAPTKAMAEGRRSG